MPNPTMTTKSGTKSTTQTAPKASTGAKTGWEKTCDCGFSLRNYHKGEFVSMVNQHLKTSHSLPPYSEADVIKGAKPITL